MILNTQDAPLAQSIIVAPFRALLSSCAPINKPNNNQQGVDINREWESSCMDPINFEIKIIYVKYRYICFRK